MTSSWPKISVIIPARNEAEHLRAAVTAVLGQGYPGELEIVLAVAPSDDGTQDLAAELARTDPRIVVVENPRATAPSGLNCGIAVSSGEIVARVDAHAELADDYLATAVNVLTETKAWNVGGIQRAVGTSPMQRAVAAAMSSRFGAGNSRFHYGGVAGPTDTVYLGVFPREVLVRLGGFDEKLVRNQDYELNIRIRAEGGQVWFDPRMIARYHPRASLRSLASQYWQYGRWKRVVLRQHPGSLRLRQMVPPAAALANAAGFVGTVVSPWTLVIPTTYLTGVAVASAVVGRGQPSVTIRLPAAFITMHMAWGFGFMAGPPRGTH